MDLEFLKNFHRRRVKVLANSDPDLIAFETIPNKLEAQAFSQLLEEEDINIPAWLSFNSKDGINIVSGDSLLECVTIAELSKKIVAVGIKCTPPRYIQDLILCIKKVTKNQCLFTQIAAMVMILIRSGCKKLEFRTKTWVSYVNNRCEVGASLVGRCCRTTPHTIRAIYRTLSSQASHPFFWPGGCWLSLS